MAINNANKKMCSLFSGTGKLDEFVRLKEWSLSDLGNPEDWPQELCTMASMIMHNPSGMAIAWGKNYLQIFNEGFRSLIQPSQQQAALGKSAKEIFPDLWHLLKPMYLKAMKGESGQVPGLIFTPGKSDFNVTRYFDFLFSPVFLNNGKVEGVLVIIKETYPDLSSIETSITQEEQIFRNMIMESPNGVCVINVETMLSEIVNTRFLKITNLREDAIIGKKYWEVFDKWRPVFEKQMVSVIESGQTYTAREVAFPVNFSGSEEMAYASFIFSPLKNEEGVIKKIVVWEVDNTPQVEARKKIAEREQEMITLVENAPFPIGVFTGEEMSIQMANQSIIKAWGKGNEVIGKLYADILPEFKNQEIFEQLRTVYTTGVAFYATNRKVEISINGSLETHFYNYSFTPLFDASGQVYGVLNTAAEVTELQEAKQQVEKGLQELKFFKFIADMAADSFILIREDGSFAYLNNVALEKWGYSAEEIQNLNVEAVDPLHNAEKFKTAFRFSEKETIPPFENYLKTKDGLIYPAEVSVARISLEGKPCLFAIARDITERKKTENNLLVAFQKVEESEKRFRDSVQQAPLGITIIRGNDFVVEQANAAFLIIIDKTAEEFIGKPIFESLPEVKEIVKPIFEKIIQTGKPFFGNEFEATLRRMGKLEKTYFNFVYHPLKEDNQEISGIMVVAMEVTPMVKAKQLLEESEKHFRNMVMYSPIPMTILKGPNFIIESANKAMLETLWRKKFAEVHGRSLLTVFPELYDQKYPDLLKKVFTSGQRHHEKEALLKVEGQDGSRQFFVDFEYAPLFETNRNISGIMFTATDVTDKLDARKKIEEAEERIRLSTEITGIATWDLDLTTRQIIHSSRLIKIFGHPENTVLTHSQMRNQIHPEDIFLVKKGFDLAMETSVYEYEVRLIKPDGKIIWIRTQGKVFYDDKQQPAKMLGTLRDITEEKQYQQILQKSETKFRLLANSLAQQVWTADAYGEIFYFNETVYKYSGLTESDLEKGGWINMIHPEDREGNLRIWTDSINSGKDFLVEHRFKRYDNEYRWQLSRALPQRDAEGNIHMWIGSSTDIQDIKEQEQQKDYFISMASHELKTPLTSIKGYVQILQAMQPKVEASFLEKSLKIMDKQINTLTTLIAELLDVSKIKSGGLDFKKELFELTELLTEVISEIRHINPAYTISLKTCAEIMVLADRNRMGQVLINLLNNAVKYSPNSNLINVTCEINENEVEINIEDFGIGINKPDQQKIFDRFYRVEGRNEKTFPGFGIGLFISSEIIKRHHGKIRLKSKVGPGSIFSIKFPIKG